MRSAGLIELSSSMKTVFSRILQWRKGQCCALVYPGRIPFYLRILETTTKWSPVVEPRKTKGRLHHPLPSSKAVKRGEFEPSKHRVISEKGEKRDCILTVLFRTSMLGNFLLMYLRDDSMDFSSKKGGLDLGSEQVCTDKPHYSSTLSPAPQKHTSSCIIHSHTISQGERGNLGINYKRIR